MRACPALLTLVVLAASCSGAESGATSDPEAEVQALLDVYMEEFNKADNVAWSRTLNYPHVRIASGSVRVWESAEKYADAFDFAGLKSIGWHHSEWDAKRILHAGKEKAHVAVRFTRYRADGSKIATFDAMYVVTKVDGHWGVQARSSFAP